MALNQAVSERTRCESRRESLKSAKNPSLGQIPIVWQRTFPSKIQNSRCAQFENIYTAQQAREEILRDTFNCNINDKLIRITVWFSICKQ